MRLADAALLDDLWDELQRGRVYECSIRDPKLQVDGLQDGENIYIDPRPAVLETVIHELLHRRKPRWSERTVTRTARALVVGLDEPAKARWWRGYSRIKRRSVPVETADE